MQESIRFQGFGVNPFKRGDTVVPLKQGRGWAHPGNCMRIEFPNRVDHRMIVGIQNVLLELGMAGDMDLSNSLRNHAIEVLVRIEIMVPGRNIDVVNVQ